MSRLATDKNGKGIQALSPDSTETVSISGTASTNTAVNGGNVRVQRLVSDVNCFYSVVGTATTSSVYLPANVIEFIHVRNGDQLSIITDGSTGIIYITDMV